MMHSTKPGLRLLWFNLSTDADEPVLAFTSAWINAAAKHCEYIDVVTMRAGRLVLADNVRVYSLGKEMGYSEPRRAVEFYRILWRLLKARRYDACFSHMNPLFVVMGAPLLKAYRLPVTLWFAHKSTPLRLRTAEMLTDKVVTSTAEGFRVPSRKIQVIGQGIDTDIFVPPSAPRQVGEPFTIICTGRIAPIKHVEHIIEAARLLRDDHHLENFRVKLIGNVFPHDAGYAEGLRQQVSSGGLESIVEFAGPVLFEDIVTDYQQADIAVNMSATGSADKVVLEAMSCGIPAISANDAYKVILSGWADTLLTPPDDPAALARRIMSLASMSVDERRRLGADVREVVVKDHSLNRLMHRLLYDILC